MRARFSLPLLAIVIVITALAVAGCSSQETESPAGTAEPTAAEPAAGEGSGYVTVDVLAADEALSSNADAQLLDVREPAEWAETGVPQGAVLIPLGEVQARASSELAPEAPVYVICRSGNRSQAASEILLGLGFSEVYNVDGGVNAWLAEGLPMETYRP